MSTSNSSDKTMVIYLPRVLSKNWTSSFEVFFNQSRFKHGDVDKNCVKVLIAKMKKNKNFKPTDHHPSPTANELECAHEYMKNHQKKS